MCGKVADSRFPGEIWEAFRGCKYGRLAGPRLSRKSWETVADWKFWRIPSRGYPVKRNVTWEKSRKSWSRFILERNKVKVRQSSSDDALNTEVESVDGEAAVSNRNFGLKVHREYERRGTYQNIERDVRSEKSMRIRNTRCRPGKWQSYSAVRRPWCWKSGKRQSNETDRKGRHRFALNTAEETEQSTDLEITGKNPKERTWKRYAAYKRSEKRSASVYKTTETKLQEKIWSLRYRRWTRSALGISRTQVHDRGPVKVGNLVD